MDVGVEEVLVGGGVEEHPGGEGEVEAVHDAWGRRVRRGGAGRSGRAQRARQEVRAIGEGARKEGRDLERKGEIAW